MRKAVLSLAVIALCSFSAHQSKAQNVSGKIIRTATNATANGILDPAATPPSGYTSKTTAGFLGDDVGNAKLGFKAIPTFSFEPFGDLRRGANHLYSDFVPDVNGNGVYLYFDGTNLLFRMRLGTIVPGAKGYSILIDTDLKFGASGPNADPNYLPATTGVNGNPGFEREIVLATGGTNDGILVYNIDGNDNPSALTPIATYAGWISYSQISIAGTNDNGDPDFFLDFYVPLSALGTGITSGTPLRFSATTVMAGQAAIGGPKSDIYGLNDNSYKSTNTEWEAYINAQPSITASALSGSGTATTSTLACTAAPSISSVTTTGGANGKGVVTGTWTKLASSSLTSALITVYRNGTPLTGAATATSGTTWTYDIPASVTLASGNSITAQAQAAGESTCQTSNNYVVTACPNSSWVAAGLPAPQGDAVSGNDYSCFLGTTATTNKGVGGTNRTSSAWTIYVNEAVTNTTKNSVSNQGSADFTNGGSNTTFTAGTTPNWLYSKGCQTGSPMANGTYAFWYQDAGGCKSEITPVCSGMTSRVVMAPTVSPGTVTTSTTSLTVTGAAGSDISLYYDGEVIATGTIPGTFNNTTTGAITFSGLSFGANGVVSAVANHIVANNTTTSYCMAKSSSQTVALCTTSAPVITADNSNQITAGQPITGTSAEPAGTTIKVYTSSNSTTPVATVTVAANGSWTTGSYTAVAGTVYNATAQNATCSVSAASASATAAAPTSSARCGAITGPVSSSVTSVSGTLSGTATSATVNLYQDGMLIGTTSTSANSWIISTLTQSLNPNSILTIGVKDGANQEVLCASSAIRIVCAAPPSAPVIVSPANPTISPNTAITYTLSGITSGDFYGIVDANSGKTLSDGLWAPSNSNIDITTYPFTGSAGTVYDIQVKVSSVSSTAVCSNYAIGNVIISSTLPVTFLSLSATKVPTGVQINWTVNNEHNVAHYTVERSTDCIHFEEIGKVAYTAGTSSIRQYDFTDPNSVTATVCYRIKQVDLDGKGHYSSVIPVQAYRQVSVRVAPNPATENATVYITATDEGTASISVMDGNGQVVLQQSARLHQGTNAVPLNMLSRLSKGSYFIRVVSSDGAYHQKFLLQ